MLACGVRYCVGLSSMKIWAFFRSIYEVEDGKKCVARWDFSATDFSTVLMISENTTRQLIAERGLFEGFWRLLGAWSRVITLINWKIELVIRQKTLPQFQPCVANIHFKEVTSQRSLLHRLTSNCVFKSIWIATGWDNRTLSRVLCLFGSNVPCIFPFHHLGRSDWSDLAGYLAASQQNNIWF